MTDATNPGDGPPPSPGPASSELATGSMFGKYKIVRIAGRGGKGIVYEALDSILDRKVALKIIRPETLNDTRALELESHRFLTEARLLANLPKHDHIVGVYEAGDLEGKRFLSMEFVEGRPMTGWRGSFVAGRAKRRS